MQHKSQFDIANRSRLTGEKTLTRVRVGTRLLSIGDVVFLEAAVGVGSCQAYGPMIDIYWKGGETFVFVRTHEHFIDGISPIYILGRKEDLSTFNPEI